ncbi:hypothetical protein [Rahnella sp. EDr1-12]|jgi:hypothetical protein|uniref:hypothetical protein n=1 Tax=unclassified Rahnella TaxID=2635087 RepID=UPI003BA9DE85
MNTRNYKIEANDTEFHFAEIFNTDEDGNIIEIILTSPRISYKWQPECYTIKAIDNSFVITNQDVFGLRVIGDVNDYIVMDAKTNNNFEAELKRFKEQTDLQRGFYHFVNART